MDTTPKPTPKDALTWITNILTWWKHIPAQPHQQSTIEHHIPNTNNETRLPFGLDAKIDDLDQGPTGIRTSQGAHQHLQQLAYWLWTSNLPSSPPNYQTPATWIHTMLTTPYPWQEWGTDINGNTGIEWAEWADDLHQTHNVIARLTGNHAQPGHLCPNGHTTWTKDTNNYTCKCGTWTETELPEAQKHALRAPHLDTNIHVTGKQAIEIWDGELDHDTLRDWVRHGRITTTTDTPRQYPLAQLNQLATNLIGKR